MPPIRPQAPAPTRGQAARAITNSLGSPRVESLAEQIRAVGGTRAASQLVGNSQRTMQHWARGDVQNIPAHARRVLARASITSRNNALIQELGGIRRTAQLTNRTESTIRKWARGEILNPLPDARRFLQRADAARRMRAQGLNVDPATGRPRGPVFLQMKGEIRVNISRNDGYHYPTRQIGTSEADQISPELMAQLVDALGQGDIQGVQAALENHLSTEYLGQTIGRYDPDQGIGVFIDRVDEITFSQDEDGEQPTS